MRFARPIPGFPRLRALVLLAVLLAGTGCATYHQAVIGELPPQQRVRVRLAPDDLARHIAFASGNQGFIEGRFVELVRDSATFLFTSPTAHAQVRLPLESVLVLERKESSQGRSMLLTAALVGGVAALAYFGFDGSQDTEPYSDDDLTDQLVPGIRIVIPIGR